MFRRRQNTFDGDEYDDDYENHNRVYEDSSLGEDSDSYELPDEDEDPLDDEESQEEQNEFNQNIGWDGRRRGDLY
jgi:hypothetical protein